MSSLSALPNITGFYSYSRGDDKNTRGSVSKLHQRIQSELWIQLGRSESNLCLWKDTSDIRSGTVWQKKIEGAAADAVFFITIVSPGALNSTFCQFEFAAFEKREAELGRDDLIFPILYADVPELHDAEQRAQQPILRLLHNRQYLDWRQFRHDDVWSADMGRKIEAFCKDITNALRQSWIPLEERRQKEIEAATRAAEEAERLKAEAERRRSEQAFASARAAEELARQAADARRAAEETWRSVSQMARTRLETARQAIQEALARQTPTGGEPGTDVALPTPTWNFVVMPWKPVETLQQARALIRFGVGSLAVLAAVFVLMAIVFAGQYNAGPAVIVCMLAAIASAACAFGTSRNWRAPAIVGFVLSLLPIPFLPFLLPAALFAYAAVKGTAATQRLSGASL